MTFTRLVLVLAALACGACSTFQGSAPPNQFVIEKPFVRDTLASEYLAGTRIHRFQPILTDSLVIAGNGIDGIAAYNRKSGGEKWRLAIKDGVESGATLEGQVLYFGAGDGLVYAVDARNGRVIWSAPLKAEGLSEPVVSGDALFILAGNNVARSLNRRTGQLNWVYDRQDRSNLSIRGGSRPLVSGSLVYFGFSDGYLVALNRQTGSIFWEANLNVGARRFRDVDAAPVLVGDQILIGSYDGGLYSVNKDTGTITWRVEGGGYEAVEVRGKTVFASTTNGEVMALDVNSGKILWNKKLKGNLTTGPILANRILITGEYAGSLIFMDPTNGEVISKFDPGRGVTSRAAVDNETNELYFISGDANLYGLRFKWQKFQTLWPWQESL